MPIVDPVCSSDSIWRGIDMSRSISDDLTALETDVAALKESGGEHSHPEYALVDHTHTGFATENHVHTGYASVDHTHTGFASANHTHTGFAASVHSHDEYAASGHTHTGFAAENHTHTGFAASGHNHDGDYLPADGDVNVQGVLKVNGQQAIYYSTGTNSQTIGTNNATGGTTIACGASAAVNVNGTKMNVSSIVPKATNTYNLGNSTNRWKGIYSAAAVNVSSDERLKRDVKGINHEALAGFINKLNVVSYNYKDDADDRKARIGLIAQQVQTADPEIAKFFVNEDENGYLNLAPADLVFALIAAVQEMRDEILDLKARLG